MSEEPAASPPAADAVERARAAVSEIWEQQREGVVDRLDVIERALTDLIAGHLGDDLRAEAEREAHKLAGAAGTFGFPRASERARAIELALGPHRTLGPAQVPALADSVVALRDELEGEPVPVVTTPEPAPREDKDGEGPLVLVVDDDRELAGRLAGEAVGASMRADVCHSPAEARALVARRPPDLVILDLGFPDGHDAAFALLSELADRSPPVPVLILTISGAFTDRVEVARRGGRGFLLKSLRPDEVIAAASDMLQRLHESDVKLLAVDDDPAILAVVRKLLEQEGLDVTTLSEPLRLGELLDQVRPDLLLLDVDMPGVSGIELCRVVRSDPRWAALPILFLTSRRDPETLAEVFEAGADDYLNKPILGPELTMRIRNRLERMRLYRTLAETDALTGVANRRKASETLAQFARLAERFDQPLSLAQLDLDGFKQVNDRFGHAAGDAVLRRLCELLARMFRGDDIVGRWGGEEFIVGMYAMGREDAVARIAEALEAFRAFDLRPEEVFEPVTFSAGVAELPRDAADVTALHRAADDALYAAKDAGGDRIVAAGRPLGEGGEAVDVVVVEDDEAIRELLLHSLETRGYRTRSFEEGPAASAALAGPEPPLRGRVVLLDVDLPGLDGLSMLRRLAADGRLARTRVIMLTARSAETEVLQALELGAFDHVAKPFSVPVLMQKIRRALEA